MFYIVNLKMFYQEMASLLYLPFMHAGVLSVNNNSSVRPVSAYWSLSVYFSLLWRPQRQGHVRLSCYPLPGIKTHVVQKYHYRWEKFSKYFLAYLYNYISFKYISYKRFTGYLTQYNSSFHTRSRQNSRYTFNSTWSMVCHHTSRTLIPRCFNYHNSLIP